MSAPLQHQRGHGVAEQMAGPALAGCSAFHVIAHQGAEMVRTERLALCREENGSVVRVDGQLWSDLVQVFIEPCQGTLAHRHHAVSPALANRATAHDNRKRSVCPRVSLSPGFPL